MTLQELTIKVESALEEIRPYLISDGGNISLIEIVDNVVKVKLEGTCGSCSINQMTLTNGVEATIKRNVPQIEKVIEVGQESNS
jgi:Fe-S cluster biogenesis protein NfuA